MRATAQLDRMLTGLEDAHEVAVLVAEERDRPEALGVFLRRLVVPHRSVGDDLGIGERLDRVELVLGDGAGVTEVKTQAVRRDERTRLLNVRAKHFAQRPMQDVGGGVVPADAITTHTVDRGRHLVALRELAPHELTTVHDELGHAVLRVEHAHLRAGIRGDRAGVTNLATRLGIEGRAVEHDLDRSDTALGSRVPSATIPSTLAATVVSSWRPVNSVGPTDSTRSR